VPSIAPAPREQDDDSSWLVDSLERQHLLDLTKRLLHANHVPFAVAFAAVVVMGPWYGWWPILPVVLGSIVYRAVERRLDRKRRPEFAFGAAWLIAQAANAAAYFVATIPAHPEHYVSPAFALPLLMIMVVSASAVMPPRGVLIASAFTAAIMVAVTLHMDAAVVTRRPSELAFSLALLITIAMIGCAVGRSAVNHRGAAIVDGLTGLLNRRALEVRTIELGHQAAATGEPVAVVIGDVDNFKRINDERGHATGDRALAAVAERLHGELRAFEGLYRFGGEEFAVLLAGTSAAEALATAERLRVAVAAGSIEGIPVTMSFGIAATSAGQAADFDELFAEADRALYQAKRAGRDRVVGATPMLAPARAA
jgi:diguanylate cyclase (GGDEF)-like protein